MPSARPRSLPLLLLVLLCLATPAAAQDRAGSIYWGAAIGDQLTGDEAPWDMRAATKLEGMLGKSMSLIHFMAPFAHCSSSGCSYYRFPAEEMQRVRNHGAIPFFSC